MHKRTINRLPLALFIAATSCQTPAPKETKQNTPPSSKNTTMGQNLQPAESGYTDVNALKMYYEVYGKGKPTVLLHGSFMTIPLNWSHIIPLLAKDRKVIVTEMQGHGRTRDIPRDISYEGMADDVSALLAHLKTDSADMIGYSMGGGIAFQMAVRHPQQVRRLVVLSGTYRHDGWWPDAEAGFATFTPEMFEGTMIKNNTTASGTIRPIFRNL